MKNCLETSVRTDGGGPVVVEGGIAKFPAGRLPEEAAADAARAWERKPADAVFRIGPETSLDEVNALDLAPGATVLFRRGCKWRGQLRAASGVPGNPIRYGAWGEGAAPAIMPSVDASDPAAWRDLGNGLWSFGTGARVDVGNVVADGGGSGCLFKRGSRAELLRDRDFFFDPATGAVTVFSEAGNPGARWRSVELCQKLHGVDQCAAHDVEYEGLDIRFAGAHGFGGGGVARIAIRGCRVSWIGGGYLYVDDLGNGVRYGNGIELWGGAEDVAVENCAVSQCWDAGITNQTNEPGSVQRNVVWRGNEVSDCEYSYEFWHQGEGGAAENVVLGSNAFRDAGCGWGHAQRWNPNAAHLMFYDTTVPTPGFEVRGNRFGRTAGVAARVFNDWRGQAVFAGNEWAVGAAPLCRFHGRPRGGLRFLYPDRLDRIHDDNVAEIESQGAGGGIVPSTAEGRAKFESLFA
ncbi:MAG: right-handed parallel beta-helix repeat-containing protein [Kiritimatiellae bacterium]|nr:right-handed parallel beta-helix repeat-containing protein [Kiritimatiellia bacterium]